MKSMARFLFILFLFFILSSIRDSSSHLLMSSPTGVRGHQEAINWNDEGRKEEQEKEEYGEKISASRGSHRKRILGERLWTEHSREHQHVHSAPGHHHDHFSEAERHSHQERHQAQNRMSNERNLWSRKDGFPMTISRKKRRNVHQNHSSSSMSSSWSRDRTSAGNEDTKHHQTRSNNQVQEDVFIDRNDFDNDDQSPVVFLSSTQLPPSNYWSPDVTPATAITGDHQLTASRTSGTSNVDKTTQTGSDVHKMAHHHQRYDEQRIISDKSSGSLTNNHHVQSISRPSNYHHLGSHRRELIEEHEPETRIHHSNNISVLLVKWTPPAIKIGWDFDPSKHVRDLHTKTIPKKLEAFRITYHPINSKYRIIQEVSPTARNITLDRLLANTEYIFKIYPLFQNEPIGDPTHSIRFIPPSDEASRLLHRSYGPLLKKINQDLVSSNRSSSTMYQVHVGSEEVIIVSLVLIAWMVFIMIFIKKWGKIRTLEPCPYESTKNGLDSPLIGPNSSPIVCTNLLTNHRMSKKRSPSLNNHLNLTIENKRRHLSLTPTLSYGNAPSFSDLCPGYHHLHPHHFPRTPESHYRKTSSEHNRRRDYFKEENDGHFEDLSLSKKRKKFKTRISSSQSSGMLGSCSSSFPPTNKLSSPVSRKQRVACHMNYLTNESENEWNENNCKSPSLNNSWEGGRSEQEARPEPLIRASTRVGDDEKNEEKCV